MRELGVTYTAEERRKLNLSKRHGWHDVNPLTLTDEQRARLSPAELNALPASWLMTLADIRAMEES